METEQVKWNAPVVIKAAKKPPKATLEKTFRFSKLAKSISETAGGWNGLEKVVFLAGNRPYRLRFELCDDGLCRIVVNERASVRAESVDAALEKARRYAWMQRLQGDR